MANASNVVTPSSNTAATHTMPATVGRRNRIGGIVCSYSAAPTGGKLKIESPAGTTIFETDIIAGGPQVFSPISVSSAVNAALVTTLSAGGAGINGKLTILNATTGG